MIPPDFLAILRCPLDPSHTGLDLDGVRLLCQRCRLAFPIRDGFPTLLVEEAVLPEGCKSVDQLPCQRDKTT